jgi:tRNA modification GTPase
MSGRDTIFAPASGSGRAALTVLRLSGPASREVCRRLTGRLPPPPRQATLRPVRAVATDDLLDRALLLWFEAPASFTGEDVLELHLHGGPGVLTAVVEELEGIPAVRPAEPGEFARRAFLNGRLDLTAAEGLADLVAAETRAQVRQASRVMDGELQRLYDGWRETLLSCLGRVEAEIDFAADEEVPEGALEAIRPTVVGLARALRDHLADGRRGERLREGFVVALVGPPNAGKSSLLNRLAQRDVAIVTAEPGTTRDVLEVALDLGGYPVRLLDTAGLREAAGLAEAEGVRRALQRADEADLRLVILDGASWPDVEPPGELLARGNAWPVVNKADLGRVPADTRIDSEPAVVISCLTGAGLAGLVERLTRSAAAALERGAKPAPTRARHRAGLEETVAALERAVSIGPDAELALVAEELRLAAQALGRLTGRIDVDDVLDRIFGDFCIGK